MATAHMPYGEPEATLGVLRDRWGWFLGIGIVFVVLGTFGVLTAVLFTLVSVVMFGALLVAGAILQAIDAYRAVGRKSRISHAVIALLYAIAGILMLADPVDASVALTLVLALALMVVGLIRLVMAYQMRPARGWGWALAAGIASLLLGGIILIGWPHTALWVIGLIVAIELIVNGWMCIFLAFAARNAGRRTAGAAGT